MQRTLFTEEEIRLAAERRRKYMGTAKVIISQIQFDPPLPRDLDPKNLDRLREIFRKNRCRRLDVDNHVPAIVSQEDLAVALRKADVPQRALLTNDPHQLPQLRFAAGQLRALHGRHRVQAGAEVLPPADRWWTVDLYLDDIGEGLRTSLVEEYANQKKPTDGEIYRKIRQYEGDGNEAFRQRWFVRLSRSNQERLDQLDNRKNRRLRLAFDRLLPIPGLWPHGMRISMLHRLIATGCVEEILTYLGHIGDFWSSLVASDPDSMKKIDPDTVDALQLLAPGKSRIDTKMARGLVLGGQAFADFSDEERRVIWKRLANFDGLVPSLYTFFEDFKYLESCAHCVKRLFSSSSESVWKTMSSIFVPYSGSEVEERLIQTSESTFRREPATDAERLDMGYLQIWLYAMRHYPLMPPDPKSDDDLLAKSSRAKADKRAIYEMAELARRLGFWSPEIEAIIDGSPDREIARAALLQARKPNRFRYDKRQLDTLISRIVDCFSAAVPDQPEIVHELLADSTVKPRARCGLPRMRTHKQDSPLLFVDRLHAEVGVADTITTFFVRRCVYFAFFGKPAQPGPAEGENNRETPGDRDIPPLSPLFVGEDGPSAHDVTTMHADLPRELSQQEPAQSQPLGARQDAEQQTLPSQQVPTGRREQNVAKRRRAWKLQTRRRGLRQESESNQEPMDVEWLSTEHLDQDMPDQEAPELPESSPVITRRESLDEAITIDSAMAATAHLGSLERITSDQTSDKGAQGTLSLDSDVLQPMHGPENHEEADTNSQCTRISVGSVSHERDLEERLMIDGPHDSDAPDRTRVDGLQHQSSEPEQDSSDVGSGRQQQVSDAYLDQLMRAQEEQERLEEELERERLNEELGLSNEEQPVQEVSPGFQERQDSLSRPPDNEPVQAPRSTDSRPTQDPTPISPREGQMEPQVESLAAPSPTVAASNPDSQSPRAEDDTPTRQMRALLPREQVAISFWTFEREQWRQTDRIQVDPSDPAPVERVAKKYVWKRYSLYDRNLQSLKPDQCYRAATVDGNNAIFLISEDEEERLAAEGRLNKDRQLLTLVSRVVDRTEFEPGSPTKRHRLMAFKGT
ncbi:DUF3723 domain-containing protein [Aspergillus thermomutatus]|uniref:Uncharacterized protein n=1 Tax=Aspergillus thermomutatus TaxID=41047 RepID=A0A397HJX9_ASPTH|nr:uncharacterized protein CDV56_107425 [Aspergillus thermomutatus]RHZ60740.1 hypothetical protein CDV56_107425 [Aspergillus thermomutatus]